MRVQGVAVMEDPDRVFLIEAHDWLLWGREMNEPDGWGETGEHARLLWELWGE